MKRISPLFADYDNDGDKDMIVSNGYSKDMTDKNWVKMQSKVSRNAGVENCRNFDIF